MYFPLFHVLKFDYWFFLAVGTSNDSDSSRSSRITPTLPGPSSGGMMPRSNASDSSTSPKRNSDWTLIKQVLLVIHTYLAKIFTQHINTFTYVQCIYIDKLNCHLLLIDSKCCYSTALFVYAL